MSASEEERGNKRFFESLYDLDQEDDLQTRDDGQAASIAFLRTTKPVSKRPRTAPGLERVESEAGRASGRRGSHAEKQALKRSVSAPSAAAQREVVKTIPSTNKAVPPVPATVPSLLSRASSPSRTSLNTTSTKRQRTEDVKLASAARRIFAGLTFFFFPNSDANIPRRQRIRKTIEFGACWAREWSDEVTHVIVDKNATFAQLLGHLERPSLPGAIVVVNETYPAECLSYRCLLDPKQKSYQVPGQAVPAVGGRVCVDGEVGDDQHTQSSVASLPLKPPTKAVLAREPQTPSSAGGASLRQTQIHGQEGPSCSIIARRSPGLVAYDDALGASVAEARAMQDVPLDLDNEDDAPRSASRDEDPDAEHSDAGSQAETYAKGSLKQDTFQCMHKHDGTGLSDNPNARTIEILQKMAAYYDGTRDEWRTRAYRKAIATLRKQTRWVTSAAEARLLPNIGGRLADKIEEIAKTSVLRRLDAVTSDPRDVALQRFTKIYGVGVSQASKWVEQGFRTLEDLRMNAKLSPIQEIGLAHYDDFLARIPRDEVKELAGTVDAALRHIDRDFEITIGGSFRRGSSDSGDVDLIITKPNAPAQQLRAVVLEQLVPRLVAAGFLKCALAVSSKDNGSKWHGACALPGNGTPWRRIDLLLVPWEEMGAALIYFTGNDLFNRSIRLLASTKGMRLNQRGLYRDVMRGRGRQKITDGALLESRDERKIFDILGVSWRPPEHRIC